MRTCWVVLVTKGAGTPSGTAHKEIYSTVNLAGNFRCKNIFVVNSSYEINLTKMHVYY